MHASVYLNHTTQDKQYPTNIGSLLQINKQKIRSMNSHKQIALRFLVLLVLCMLDCGECEEVRCLEREREALLTFKQGLIDLHGILSSWQREECCGWYGVSCSNTTGHVISLTLDGKYAGYSLGGKISSSLLELHNLTYLDLSYNNFRGDRIPEFIGSMKQLQRLYLMNSNFSGMIPPQLGNLTNLQVLELSYNFLKSENLDWLSSLSSLIALDLSHSLDLSDARLLHQILNLRPLQALGLQSCNIGNVRPTSLLLLPFFNSSSLSYLDLSDNHLTLSVLQWLPNITNLKRVSLSNNALDGQISPSAFEKMNLLTYLDLSNNTLEGQVLKSLANLSHLQAVYLYHNSLRGNLEELLGNASFPSLQLLDLTKNELNGSVPDFGAFSALEELYLASNKLSGTIPLSLGKLSNLHVLDVARNSLEGTISELQLVNLHNLKVLDLSYNSLAMNIAPDWSPPFQLVTLNLERCKIGLGIPKWIQTQSNIIDLLLSNCGIVEVPKWLWSFAPSLKSLFLTGNNISGEIPSLSSAPIVEIDLSHNNISGPIPLFHPNTSSFQLSNNMFSGSISSLCEYPHNQLFHLDLSNNMLSGEIPNCWENMPHLFFLDLARNTFSGEIPHSLGSSLPDLSLLQLRGNNLSGELPSTLRFCQSLTELDVAENELSGNIPAWLGYTKMTFLNLHGNRFSGSISSEICNLAVIQVLDFSRNNLSGEIPDCFGNFISLVDTNTIYTFVGFRYSAHYNPFLPHYSFVKDYSESLTVEWKGQEREYDGTLILLKFIDLSSNALTGSIPQSFSSMKALNSLNLSRNSLSGNIIPDIDKMEKLESLDLSHNQLSGEIPKSLARVYSLGVLDLSNNNLSGKIPTSAQLQSFNATVYAGNNGLCGPPLELCPEDRLRPSTKSLHEKKVNLSFMQEVFISSAAGFILGFWGLVGSLIVKRPWRIAYFSFFQDVGDWFHVKTAMFLSRCRRS